MLSFSSTFTFGLQTDFYQIELSRVRGGVEFQSFMIRTDFHTDQVFPTLLRGRCHHFAQHKAGLHEKAVCGIQFRDST